MTLLTIQNLSTHFETSTGVVRAVDEVSLSIESGEVLGLVGESGSGKSVLAMTILRLIPEPPGRIMGGRVLWRGSAGEENLVQLPKHELRRIRGKEIAMIFQEPMTALNPVMTIGRQIAEVFEEHTTLVPVQVAMECESLLHMVGIPSPKERVDCYPHELSGGQRQRVMIAMALACRPKLLIADEPTTALDVTIQAQILALLQTLQKKMGMAMLFITHDMGVVAQIADRIAVMHNGKLVETGTGEAIFYHAQDPYTQRLLNSVPKL